jgi:signal transduction histidine kinase
LELTSNLPLIHIDHIQIEQVILNLIRNGIDAILSTSEKRLGQIFIQSYLTPNNEIQVRIKDNGSGIDEDQQAQILMPFHTTKPDGMGMGLSISRSLIEAHNGTLHFNSQFGKGSTFYFTLPI